MPDIFDAVEKHTAELSFSIRQRAIKRGWAWKPYSFTVAPDRKRSVIIICTSLELPYMRSVAFLPRSDPEEGGKSWQVDIKRSDGRIIDTWRNGFTLTPMGGKFEWMYGAIALSKESLDLILDDLSLG